MASNWLCKVSTRLALTQPRTRESHYLLLPFKQTNFRRCSSTSVRQRRIPLSFRFPLMPLNRPVSTRLIIDFTMILSPSSQSLHWHLIPSSLSRKTSAFCFIFVYTKYKSRIIPRPVIHRWFRSSRNIPLADASVRMSRE